MAAFYGGVKQGDQYLKGGVVSVLRNKYTPVYRLATHRTSQFTASPNVVVSNAYMSYNSSPSASCSALNGTTQWTVECIVYPLISTTPTEKYLFDPRSGNDSKRYDIWYEFGIRCMETINLG